MFWTAKLYLEVTASNNINKQTLRIQHIIKFNVQMFAALFP